MPSNAMYRDEHTTFRHALRESPSREDPFVQEIADQNQIIRKVLIHNNICTMNELSLFAADFNKQTVFLKNINKRLKIIVFGMIPGILGYSIYLFQTEYYERIQSFNESLSINKIYQKEIVEPAILDDHKMRDIGPRNIFLPLRTSKPVVQSSTQLKVDELIQNYKIVGIVIDREVKGIIENIKQQETIFVSIGDKIGEAIIVKILPDKIICELDGHELEILP